MAKKRKRQDDGVGSSEGFDATRAARRAGAFVGWGLLALAVEVGALGLGAGGRLVLGFPVHHDDFRNLSYTSLGELPSLSVRPVSTLVLDLLSVAGPPVYYGTLQILVALYVVLVVSLIRALFPSAGRSAPLAAGAAVVAALLFENTPEYALYSGLVTNLVSAVTGVGAMLAFEAEPRSRGGRLAASAGAVALFAASLLAKEDFALAVTLWFALRALERWFAGDRHRRTRDAALLLTLLLVCAAFLGWSLSGATRTFLRGSGETYRSVFSPASLLQTTFRYLLCTPGAQIATGVQLAVLLLVGLSGDRRATARVAGIVSVTLALVVPYAALPNHFAPYYAFNWTVWQAATLVALAPLLDSTGQRTHSLLVSVVALALGGWMVVTHPARVSLIRWYGEEAGRNRAIQGSLDRLRDALRPWPVVGVTGVMPLNPWFGNDGAYLRTRLGLTNRWVVFASPDYVQRALTLPGAPRRSSIEVRDVAEMSRARIPVIGLTPEGVGTMGVPAPGMALRAPGAIRFEARPERLRVCDGSGLGVTRLEWTAPAPMEVRVGSPDGPLFAGPAPTGGAETGKWVNDGATFFLRGPSGEVAGVVSVRVSAEGCR